MIAVKNADTNPATIDILRSLLLCDGKRDPTAVKKPHNIAIEIISARRNR